MKPIAIALAVLASLSLAGCVEEVAMEEEMTVMAPAEGKLELKPIQP